MKDNKRIRLTKAAEPVRRTVRGVRRETERRTGEVAPVPVDDLSPSVTSSQGTMVSNTVPNNSIPDYFKLIR